jgi:hypothetical protein
VTVNSPTADPKEALERLKARAAKEELAAGKVQGPSFRGSEWGADIIAEHRQHADDLSWLIAEREGLEREVEYKEERRVYWQKEAERLHEQSEARWKVQDDLFVQVMELSSALDEANSCLWIIRPENVDAESYARIVAARDHNNGCRALLHPTVPVKNNN